MFINQCTGPFSLCDVISRFLWFMNHKVDFRTLRSYFYLVNNTHLFIPTFVWSHRELFTLLTQSGRQSGCSLWTMDHNFCNKALCISFIPFSNFRFLELVISLSLLQLFSIRSLIATWLDIHTFAKWEQKKDCSSRMRNLNWHFMKTSSRWLVLNM